MNDPSFEFAVERAMRAEAEYKRLDAANRAHNRRMVWVAIGAALLIFAAVIVLALMWPAL